MPDRPAQNVATRSSAEFLGKYRGRVVDNVDPLKKGRLKVVVPQVLGSVEVWATPCVPYAGPKLGLFTIPEPETGVWIEFEAGDASYPIWTGFFWNDGDIDSSDADPSIKFFRTKKFTLRIDDSNGAITIENDSGSQIELTAEGIVIKSMMVRQEASGGRKTLLNAAAFLVNDGGLEVL